MNRDMKSIKLNDLIAKQSIGDFEIGAIKFSTYSNFNHKNESHEKIEKKIWSIATMVTENDGESD